MLHELGKLLSRIARGSLLGDSLLVRARTTSFAVLGASASVGLAVLAIALHEDWPLVPGSPPPRPVARHAALGEATAVGAERSPTRVAGGASAPGGSATGASRGGHRPPPGASPHPVRSTGSVTAPTGELVVSPSVRAPESSGKGGSGGARSPRIPAQPAKPKPAPTVKTPALVPTAPPPPPPSPPPPPPAPEATASASPPEQSNVPPWSNGQGHAYGREDSGHGHSSESGD